MARQKSVMVSEHGKSHELLERLSWAVQDAGGDDELLREALEFGEVRKRIGLMAVAHRRIRMEGVTTQFFNDDLSERELAGLLRFETSVYVLTEHGKPKTPYRAQTYGIFSAKELMLMKKASEHLNAFGFRLATNQEALKVIALSHIRAWVSSLPLVLTGHVFTVSGGSPVFLQIVREGQGEPHLVPRPCGSTLDQGDTFIGIGLS